MSRAMAAESTPTSASPNTGIAWWAASSNPSATNHDAHPFPLSEATIVAMATAIAEEHPEFDFKKWDVRWKAATAARIVPEQAPAQSCPNPVGNARLLGKLLLRQSACFP